MLLQPPIDTTHNQLDNLLATRGLTPDWLNTEDPDPYSPANIARLETHNTAKRIPRQFAAAIPELPELHTWIDQLAETARSDQTRHKRIIATVTRGQSLLILGKVGRGKTHQAYGALRALATTGVRSNWTAVSSADLYAALRPRHGIDTETEFRRFADAPVLLLDDIGAGKASEWTEEVNFRLVNHRYERQMPTLFTSNVLPGQLADALGDRVASRLAEMCERLVLTGEDRRRRAAA